MESKEILGMMGAYASIYEKKEKPEKEKPEMESDESEDAGEDQEHKYPKKSGKKSKDYDGDGEVEDETDEYAGVKDKAIKKAMRKEEVEQLGEGVPLRGTTPDGKPWRVDSSPSRQPIKMERNPKERTSPKTGDYTSMKKGMHKKGMLNQDLDLFDIIKGHLLDEGYADTEEAALAIMANMSEEWKQSIVGEMLDEALTGERLEKAKEIIARDPKSPKAQAVKRVANSREGSDRGDTTPGDLPRNRNTPGGNTTLPTRRGGAGRRGEARTVNRAPHGAPLGAQTYQGDRGRNG